MEDLEVIEVKTLIIFYRKIEMIAQKENRQKTHNVMQNHQLRIELN